MTKYLGHINVMRDFYNTQIHTVRRYETMIKAVPDIPKLKEFENLLNYLEVIETELYKKERKIEDDLDI